MPFSLDYDAIGFLWTTVVVLFGSKPQLRKNTAPIPAHYKREVIEESALTDAQKKYFAPVDAQLAALNYRPFCTFRVANYGSNLLREYLNPADPANCTVTVVEVQTNVKGMQSTRGSQVVSFTTRFGDGKWLTTRSMELKSVMDHPDYRIIQECRNVTSLAELKKKHDAYAAKLGAPVSSPRDVQTLFEEYEMDNQRMFAYQVQRGILQFNPQQDNYSLTDKAFNRGIRNFFNPFAKRFSIASALFSLLVAAVLPLYGIFKLAPEVSERLGPIPVAGMNPATLAIALCYALTGAILGFLTEAQSYVWIVLITYIPAHLVAGSTLGRFPYSSLAFAVSYFVARAKQKRQLVLQKS
jgi:hypothetical protein